jgi:polar amino acid transport system substrate-binding protein
MPKYRGLTSFDGLKRFARASRRLGAGLCAVAMIVIVAASGGARAEQPQVAPEGTPLPEAESEEHVGPKPDWSWLSALRFVTDSDYPPFNYLDEDGALTGFNVDLARAICKELEVNCEITAADWDKMVDMLQKKEADAAVASIAITPESAAKLDFTNSYYKTPAKFTVRNGSNLSDVSPEALYGKKIGVVRGTAHEAFLRDFYADAKIEAFPGDAEAREALKTGKVDLLFGDAIGLMFWINGADSQGCCQFVRGVGFSESKYFGEGSGVAVARGNAQLREVLDYALARVRASGRFEELMLRYFPLSIY